MGCVNQLCIDTLTFIKQPFYLLQVTTVNLSQGKAKLVWVYQEFELADSKWLEKKGTNPLKIGSCLSKPRVRLNQVQAGFYILYSFYFRSYYCMATRIKSIKKFRKADHAPCICLSRFLDYHFASIGSIPSLWLV